MPNGGSDCCATCWFNAKNKGEAGYEHVHDPEPDHCVIRDLTIKNPAYTYCANHPHHNPGKITIPVGPVLQARAVVSGGFRYERIPLAPSPDTEEVRRELLRLLHGMIGESGEDYPSIVLDTVVISQLGEFRERQAIPDLRRIAACDLTQIARMGHINAITVVQAQEALRKIEDEPSTAS